MIDDQIYENKIANANESNQHDDPDTAAKVKYQQVVFKNQVSLKHAPAADCRAFLRSIKTSQLSKLLASFFAYPVLLYIFVENINILA